MTSLTPTARDLLASLDARIEAIEGDLAGPLSTDMRQHLRDQRLALKADRKRLEDNLPRVEAEAIAWSARMDGVLG